MSLIRNEQTKLLATFLNGLGIAVFAVGAFAPVISSIHSDGGPGWFTVIAGFVCLLAACALHYIGRMILKGLQP